MTRASKAAFPAIALTMASMAFAGPAFSQGTNDAKRCAAAAGRAEPATAPNRAAADGTSPGNSGSTGWTGGTGGAYIGTNPQGATQHSPTWQPPTARGLDLAMEAAPPAPADC